MKTNFLLDHQDYTIRNALTWGNCLAHYQKARVSEESSYSQRISHGSIALIEAIPIIGQIISLFEMAIASPFTPPTPAIDLTKKHVQLTQSEQLIFSHETQPLIKRAFKHIKPQELILPHRSRIVPTSLTISSHQIDVKLPAEIKNWGDALFPLLRKIESSYRALPWPSQIKKIVVLTEVCGGRGDIAAAAKAIALMQKFSADLSFDWILKGTRLNEKDLRAFLDCDNPSKVHIRYFSSEPPDKEPADLLLTGPVKLGYGIDYIQSRISREIRGPTVSFMENAEDLRTVFRFSSRFLSEYATQEAPFEKIYPYIFPVESDNCTGLLPMGIREGSGVFLEESRINAPLSRGYCCPSYLLQIQDIGLRKDILEAMNIFDSQSTPDYSQHSFNSGYAHHPASWGKFIDCVAIHEKNKHVTIVLNQRGELTDLSTQEFQEKIFTPQRLAFLKEKGYRNVIFKTQDQEGTILLQEAENPELERCLTLITRPSFTPNDMKCMQLASERLLATGDNSAVEAWCSRCKLYLYEDVANGGCKWRFLQQQVDLAQTISPNLSKLLALFGKDERLSNIGSPREPFNEQEMNEIEQLLGDPNLSNATLQFCDTITANYSFKEVLEAALKRAAWNHCIPELTQIERETLDENFQTGLINCLKNPTPLGETVLHVQALPELKQKIQQTIQAHLNNNL